MLLTALWKHWMARRRMSFYESQHAMRRAVETAGPVDMSWLTDEALMRIVEAEPGSLRAEAAHHRLEERARERLAAAAA
ncbi:MAG TPA: hypothetical protein VF449_08395, partial [Parvibaculum sp.]